jgi:hypothetical protein
VLTGHATDFLVELVRHVSASKGIHVGKLLASWRRKVSLAVRVAHVDNVLLGLSAAADDVETASSSVGKPSLAVLHPRQWPQASQCFLARHVRRRLSPPRVVFSALRGSFLCSLVFHLARFVHNEVLPFAVPWILLLPSCHSWFPPCFSCPRSNNFFSPPEYGTNRVSITQAIYTPAQNSGQNFAPSHVIMRRFY